MRNRRFCRRTGRGKNFLGVIVSAIFGLLVFMSVDVLAAAPSGVFKEAIHWGISADWLDPATCDNSGSGHFALYLFHDALLKAMPEGTYTPSLA